MSSGSTESALAAIGLLLACIPGATAVSVEGGQAPESPEQGLVGPDLGDDAMVWIQGGSDAQGALRSFWIDREEVGLAAYRRCVTAKACAEADVEADEQSPHPRGPVSASAELAEEYCAWAGKRLPSAREWLWAATGRGENRDFPWGNTMPTFRHVFAADGDHDYGVLVDESVPEGPHVVRAVLEGEAVRLWLHLPTERGSRPLGASRDGVLDLLGNVQEAVRVSPEQVAYIGGSYAFPLPGQPELAASRLGPEEARDFAVSQFMTPLTKDALDSEFGHLRFYRGFGFRCAADEDSRRLVPESDVRAVGEVRVLTVPGTRQADEAAQLCAATDHEGGRWRLPAAAELSGWPSDLVDPGLFWTAEGTIWTPEGGRIPASPRDTALVLCTSSTQTLK